MLTEMTGVLIVSRDWQSRALLRAELIEQGCTVQAYESVRDARVALAARDFKPCLLVADLSEAAGPDEPGEVDQLAEVAMRMPVWVIASHSGALEIELEGRGFEAIIFRPVAVGELVQRIKRRLAA